MNEYQILFINHGMVWLIQWIDEHDYYLKVGEFENIRKARRLLRDLRMEAA